MPSVRSSTFNVSYLVDGLYVLTLVDGQTSRHPWSTGEFAAAVANGTAAGQANVIFSSKARTLTSGSSVTIDLFDFIGEDLGTGAGLDALGDTLTMVEVVLIVIRNLSTSVGSLILGNEGSAGEWTSLLADGGELTLLPSTEHLLYTAADPGWSVADATNHLLKLRASGGNVDYDLHLAGRAQ